MERYIAIDSGKYATKVANYDPDTKKTQFFKMRTKISEGNFADDALEQGTIIAEYNGKVYKIGNGAITEAELNTSKASEIHHVCTLAAIAMCVSSDEVDDVHAVIGMPIKEWENVDKRVTYKDFILPDGEISIKVMLKSETTPVERKFRIVSKHVLPESQGALALNKLAKSVAGTVAVMDLGNLNINCTCWNNGELDRQYSLTDELGGNIMISGLSQELSATFSRCDESYVAKILKLSGNDRCLKPNRPNPEIEQKSKKLIDKYLLDHVKQIRRKCDAKHWSLDYMTLVFIGGTSDLLTVEIKEVFGDEAYIPKHPEYANVAGFLRVMCAKLLDEIIELPDIDTEEEL